MKPRAERGRELLGGMAPVHLANERRLLCALTDDERETLAGLLRKLPPHETGRA
ncbi:MAG: hypothetical protein ACLP0J_19060 [Solirubrobacteraceae bacterium]